MKNDNRIDFWCIGVQKCGTTWLYSNLRSIPEFAVPPVKELHYFDRHLPSVGVNDLNVPLLKDRVSKNKNFILTGIKTIAKSLVQLKFKETVFYYKWFFKTYNDRWYLSLFKSLGEIKGEITPRYSILNAADIKKMYELSPNAKILIMLRNPIDRAWSHFRYSQGFQKNQNKNASDRMSTDAIKTFMESAGQVNRSNYIQTISNYCEVFPKEQIMIGFYDAIVSEPEKLLNDIIGFFGLQRTLHLSNEHMSKVVYKSMELQCPDEITAYLKLKYHDQMKQLSESYGGYFTKWFEETYSETYTDNPQALSATITLG